MSLRSLNQGGEDWDVSVVMNAYKIFSLAMWSEEYICKSRCSWEEYTDYL
jgi:hypothetical protein